MEGASYKAGHCNWEGHVSSGRQGSCVPPIRLFGAILKWLSGRWADFLY